MQRGYHEQNIFNRIYNFLRQILIANAYAHDAKADDHALIGVMADHVHKKGELMLSLRYM